MAYEIGYRRPPESGRFKKGKSGNPKGRPKGSTNFLTILEQELGQSIIVNDNGKKKTITRMQAMVKRIVTSALQGDLKKYLPLWKHSIPTEFEDRKWNFDGFTTRGGRGSAVQAVQSRRFGDDDAQRDRQRLDDRCADRRRHWFTEPAALLAVFLSR